MGCKLNFSETSAIARQFVENGFERVAFGRKLDVVLINTCSVTDNADKKCRHVVNQAKKKSKNAFIIFTGCYAQLKAEEILKIDGVKAVFGAKDKFDIFKLFKILLLRSNLNYKVFYEKRSKITFVVGF